MVPRRLPVVAAALCCGVVVATSATLDGSLSTPLVSLPEPSPDSGSGTALLLLLLAWLREVFGIELDGALGGTDPPVLLPLVATVGVLVAAGGVVAVVLLLVRDGDDAATVEHARRSPVSDEPPPWPPTARTPLDRVWVALLARLDADRPHALTTGEWERRAVEDGHDAQVVRRLRSTVDRAHYDDDPPADSDAVAHRACQALTVTESVATDESASPAEDGTDDGGEGRS